MAWKLIESHSLVCYMKRLSPDPHSKSMMEQQHPYPHCNIVVCGLPGENNSSQRAPCCGVRKCCTTECICFTVQALTSLVKNSLILLTGTPAPTGLSFKLLTISKELFMGLRRLKIFSDFYRLICDHPLLNSTLDVAASPTWLCCR